MLHSNSLGLVAVLGVLVREGSILGPAFLQEEFLAYKSYKYFFWDVALSVATTFHRIMGLIFQIVALRSCPLQGVVDDLRLRVCHRRL